MAIILLALLVLVLFGGGFGFTCCGSQRSSLRWSGLPLSRWAEEKALAVDHLGGRAICQ